MPGWAEAAQPPAPVGIPDSVEGPAELVAHLDVTPENVVFRGGEATALIDFDLAAPATRVREVCNVLLWWAPWMPPSDREPVLAHVDERRRARLIVDAYGLGDAERERLVPVSVNVAERSWHLMRWRAEEFGGGWQRMWDAGVGDTIRRREAWLRANADALHAAVTTRRSRVVGAARRTPLVSAQQG